MKALKLILIILIPTFSFGTEQRPDLLIMGQDSIWINEFPIELLEQEDSQLLIGYDEFECVISDCWRQFAGTWKIENDKLFLIELRDCCDNSVIPISKVFTSEAITDNKVFAFWFSTKLTAGFGRILGFDEDKWKRVYEHEITLTVENGQVLELESTKS